MSKVNERVTHTVKFLKWTRKYNGWRQLICEPNNEHMNLSMMRHLIEQLAKESFYEIIFVLLAVHKNEPFMKSVNEALLNDLLIDKLKEGENEDIIEKLMYYLE